MAVGTVAAAVACPSNPGSDMAGFVRWEFASSPTVVDAGIGRYLQKTQAPAEAAEAVDIVAVEDLEEAEEVVGAVVEAAEIARDVG